MAIATVSRVDRLYRVLDFTRAVQIFENHELYFAHPSTWDDPFEKRLMHPKSHAVFAQCWSRIAVSDAIWRIYSPSRTGVRISTTRAKFQSAVRSQTQNMGLGWEEGLVVYLPQKEVDQRHKSRATELRRNFKLDRAVEPLFWKREAFTHEADWRVALYDPKANAKKPVDGIKVKIDPHAFVTNILLDPRAPQELVDAFTFYFKERLRFKGKVQRSALYRSPSLLEI